MPCSAKGGRPATDKRNAVRGIFRILDNGAKWKDLPNEFGSKSAVHRWFKKWVGDGVFEAIMRDGSLRSAVSTGFTNALSTEHFARRVAAAMAADARESEEA